MRHRTFNIVVSLAYFAILIVVYSLELSVNWAYMGFWPIESKSYVLISLLVLTIFSALLPLQLNTRGFLLTVVHYSFWVPSLIILATVFDATKYFYYLSAILIFWFFLNFCSAIRLRTIKSPRLARKNFLIFAFFLLVFCAGLIVLFGGMASFSLDLMRVYDFRADAAANLPSIFGYVVSGISKVIAPLCLALAIYFRSSLFFGLSLVLIVLLFGMIHHKSMLFLPVVVACFFIALRYFESLKFVSAIFLIVGGISLLELYYFHVTQQTTIPLFNSFVTRRALFVPPLLDTVYIDLFSRGEHLFWSTSRFGFGLATNPYDLTAPFLVGREHFGNEATSANTGVIGSGFAHAGLWGVGLYSALTGLLLAYFQAYGRIIGHAFVSAACFSVFLSIVTSTDFATAILTHGLLLLILLLIFFPVEK